jgi:uncharacterized protein (DUF58 family)
MESKAREWFDSAFLARLESLHLAAKRAALHSATGMRRTRRVGDGLEFADHRGYVPGDDVRFIDWPYFARMERLMVRLFHEHSEADVAILIDTSSSMDTGTGNKLRYALRAAAALAYVAMGTHERVVLQPFSNALGESLRTGRSRAQVLRVVQFLSGVAPGGRTRLAESVREFSRSHSPATVILISDLLDCEGDLPASLKQLRTRGHEVMVLHLFEPSDARPEFEGPMRLRDAERERWVNVDATPQLLAGYVERWDQFQRRCESQCAQHEAVYAASGTDVPFERLILQVLCNAGVLRA